MELEHTAGNPFIKQAFEVKIKGILVLFLVFIYFLFYAVKLVLYEHTQKKGNKKILCSRVLNMKPLYKFQIHFSKILQQ